MRHGAVNRIYQQQYRVNHGEYALYLAAEVGVAGGVHNIDAVVVPVDGGVLGENGDAALFLLVVGVHQALRSDILAVECARLAEKFINQGCFTVVNVGDNRNVTQVFNGH